ncbi:hypothetical protein QI155_10715 [Thermodesulfovibrio sp. 1176]|uniref:hypothetical protein n=1 Tax=Thermodesulfovibrio sp. 1176 TaxID=3043424 RepID=UPI002482447D|nr:hypothetical protein [Thermodesulfovibrio sp. 1176]MDI1473003.1 hypothetical protein [Thermodesulfovibrio sp. 1176]
MYRKFILPILIGFINVCFYVSVCLAEIIGTNGATYPIAESDAYEELMAKVKSTNWDRIVKDYKADIEKVTKVSFNLGRAKEDKTFYVNPTYTLQFDIMDENGRIIYPKGYSFNPLDYISFPYYLVFFDGNSVTEIAWMKKQEWFNNWNVMFILTKGDVIRAEKQLGRTVFVATPQMIEKFKISKTPSLVSTQNKQLVISEVGIYGEKKK